ncbi:MAG: hypothetical protein AAFO07_33690 [Bacteroidota bacterium]
MLRNTIRNVLLCLNFILFTCSTNSNLNLESKAAISQSNCQFIQNVVSLGSDIFISFDSVFYSFENENFEFDILIQEIGINTQLKRIYKDRNGIIRRQVFKNGKQTENFILEFDFNLEFESFESAYLCNLGSSDVGSFIYAIKQNGNYTLKLWLENGNIGDLDYLNNNNLKEISNVLSLLNSM